ncbi:MAG TPA: hypothetical protein VGQ28_07825, partial [Thermoanaerobaculia bacterium]|nr:hypothetical protein [Thermoanaerobaculia bacterium]
GNPFANYVEVERRVRGGRRRIVLLEASREFAVEVEAEPGVAGFGEVVPLPPAQAYALACARDSLRSKPVIQEGRES